MAFFPIYLRYEIIEKRDYRKITVELQNDYKKEEL
jgi:hypothetical protein